MVLLNKKQLSEELNLSVSTIDRMLEQGLPNLKIGKSIRFDLDETLSWVKKKYSIKPQNKSGYQII